MLERVLKMLDAVELSVSLEAARGARVGLRVEEDCRKWQRLGSCWRVCVLLAVGATPWVCSRSRCNVEEGCKECMVISKIGGNFRRD